MMHRNTKAEEGAVIVYFIRFTVIQFNLRHVFFVFPCVSSEILNSHVNNWGYKKIKMSKNKSVQSILIFKLLEKRLGKVFLKKFNQDGILIFSTNGKTQPLLPDNFFICKSALKKGFLMTSWLIWRQGKSQFLEIKTLNHKKEKNYNHHHVSKSIL